MAALPAAVEFASILPGFERRGVALLVEATAEGLAARYPCVA
jgi:hypothetical protein